MRILVAGATGAIGRRLIPKLVEAGHSVVGMTRHASSAVVLEGWGARSVIADAFDRQAVLSAVREAEPDVVMHQLTALGDHDFAANTRIRIEGTRHLVDAVKAAGVSRIIAQSVSWAHAPGQGPATEDEPLDVGAPLPRKQLLDGIIALETAVAELPHHVILRNGIFYGPGTWRARGGFTAERVMRGKLAATEGVTSFIHVDDAANAAVQALTWPSGPVNIVDDEPAKGIDWLPVYAAALGAPMPEIRSGSERGERGASNAKAREYGWSPMYATWRTGFADSLE